MKLDLEKLAERFGVKAVALIDEDNLWLMVDEWSPEAEALGRSVSCALKRDVYIHDFSALPLGHPFIEGLDWVGSAPVKHWYAGAWTAKASTHTIVYPIGGFLL